MKPENVVFTFNATHGLNIAIKSLVKRGDTVLISGYEHNAVTRPLHALGAVVKVAYGPLFQPEAMFRSFEEQLTPEVCAVVCNHVSNVFGYILPVERIAALCRARGVPFILDASQSAGCLPVDMSQLKAAFIAMPGHKGLYGPQGTGLLLCGTDTQPLLEGGTGSMSARQEMPDFLPGPAGGGHAQYSGDCRPSGGDSVCTPGGPAEDTGAGAPADADSGKRAVRTAGDNSVRGSPGFCTGGRTLLSSGGDGL